MSIVPDGYIPRVVDAEVDEALRTFGAIEVSGTKWCGKTWTALAHGESVSYVDLLEDAAKDDPTVLLDGDAPHVIDEWQLVPRVWDYVRHEVDRTRGLRGGWILTGSSTPRKRDDEKSSDAPRHSGAGRIGRIRMLPMSLLESGESTGNVSLRDLFKGEFSPCQAPDDADGIAAAAVRGGWPEAIRDTPDRAQKIAREYLELVFTESVPSQRRSGDVARRMVLSIARNLGQAITYKTMVGDMYGAEADPGSMVTSQTAAEYLDMLKRMYLIDELHGWEPASRSKKRLVTRPKRYLADPSLAVAALGMSVGSLEEDWQTFGLVFENMCYRDLSVYARAIGGAGFEPLRYYRDDAGLEVDFVIELADGRWAALEAKTGESKVPEAVESLKRFKKKVVSEKPHARVRPPEFMAVLTATSPFARQVEDGIYVIPLRALGV